MPNILIIDDHAAMVEIISKRFEAAGASAVGFTDPEVALQVLQRSLTNGQPFDLVALDIIMPRMDGFEVAKKMREAGYTGCIVAFTATARGTGRKQSKESGIDAYFGKETLSTELVAALLAEYCGERK